MKKVFPLLGLLAIILCFAACNNDDKEEQPEKAGTIKGLVEKGPFISGSSVTVYELDNDLNQTGRTFETRTNDEGAFSVNTSTSLVSKYIKLIVNGFYFNEYTGRLSDAPISLDAVTSIDDIEKATNVNVNVLTHLEMPRVLQLVSSGKSFEEAKEQAQKELLSAFLITDQTIVPEETSIIGNNTSSNILIAISSILLNERGDAEFTEFMSSLRNDLTDGEVSEDTKKKIADSSLRLSYSRIKENIVNRYNDLGKTVEVGEFELFIDGDNDGIIGGTYVEDIPPSLVEVENIFKTEEDVKKYFISSRNQLYSFIQTHYLLDGMYSNTVSNENLNRFSDLRLLYQHNAHSDMRIIKDIWRSAYTSIRSDNAIIEKADPSTHPWVEKYQYYAKVYRAYKYLILINLWGDVPLVTSLGNNVEDYYIARTHQNEVLDFVISELEDACQYLPENDEAAECSKDFAKAILARAYLHKKEYDRALDCARTIMYSNKYELSSSINSIYQGGNKENIFELVNSDQYSTTAYRELIEKGNVMPVIRYAEVLLIASEACLKVGNNSEALNYLNMVRNRNGRQAISDPNMENALLDEWKEDLKNEGSWFFALKRFNKAAEVLKIENNKLVLPIPISEMALNPKMVQNPGY